MINDRTLPPLDGESPPDSLWIDCYVRADPPSVLHRQIKETCNRLQRLQGTAIIADVRIKQWPRQGRTAETASTGVTREELVATFETWADRSGYALAPAFQRQVVPAGPFGSDRSERIEQLRVPQIALAIYDEKPETGRLLGVIPCTDTTATVENETYTVSRWLTAVEELAIPRVSPGTEDEQAIPNRTASREH